MEIKKELIQFVLPEKLALLKEIESWFENGREIWHESFILSEGKSYEKLEENFDAIEKIAVRLTKLRTITPRLIYLARQVDPEFKSDSTWVWGTEALPKDIPLIMDAFEDEVADQINEALRGQSGRTRPFIENQFYALHEAGHNAISRIKKLIIDQTKIETTNN
ncbi:MAG: hypothetical protein HY864_01705 [Chloroflexi bacterium]|nr:hypothetical protein [Chloroflexota bacterium]